MTGFPTGREPKQSIHKRTNFVITIDVNEVYISVIVDLGQKRAETPANGWTYLHRL
jgi:hypothetical protein